MSYSDEASEFIVEHILDSTTVVQLIKFGNVDFSKSNTKLDSCRIYHVDNSYKERDIELTVENCDSLATILRISYTKM